MKKPKKEALQTRNNLLYAALIIFDKKGVARSTLADIATQAGVTRGALYWHFKNKEDLFDALCETYLFHPEDILQFPQKNQHVTFSDLVDEINNFFIELPENPLRQTFFRILYFKCERTENNLSIVHIAEKYADIWIHKIKLMVEMGIIENIFPDSININDVTIAIRSILSGITACWLEREDFDLKKMGPILLEHTFQLFKK